MRTTFLEALGGEGGCERLSAQFYARVRTDTVLKPLFPGKSLRCATNEFAAFLIQMLGGDEERTQSRWWLSIRESHGRFRIGPVERAAWLSHMRSTLAAAAMDDESKAAFEEFFVRSSGYVAGRPATGALARGLDACWTEQLRVDDAIAAIADGRDAEALALVSHCTSRPSVFVGLLARMMRSQGPALTQFVIDAVEAMPALVPRRSAGKTLLHFAAGAGCVRVVETLLRLGADPNAPDKGGHAALYCVANECGSAAGPELVRVLARAGGDVRANGGTTRATPLHMAARRGFVGVARALLDCGAACDARDSKGVTPLERALNCRRFEVASLLVERLA